jgi:hypothetical protein
MFCFVLKFAFRCWPYPQIGHCTPSSRNSLLRPDATVVDDIVEEVGVDEVVEPFLVVPSHLMA